jgi:hypothetical protein
MATRRVIVTNTDGTVPVDKTYTISDELIPYYIEAYASIYKAPLNEDGTPGVPFTQMQVCEMIEDGIVEGLKNFVQSYLLQKSQEAAVASLPELAIS